MTAILSPLGDQVGLAKCPGVFVNLTGAPPDSGAFQICPPSASDHVTYAMYCPSGEKSGQYSRAGSDASSDVSLFGWPTALPPEISCSQMRPNASNAIHFPSGD